MTTAFIALTHAPGGDEILTRMLPWMMPIPGNDDLKHAELLHFLDLLAGDPAAAFPTMMATFDGKAHHFRWSLASHHAHFYAHVFGRRFEHLDGAYDVSLLAGPSPDRLSVVARKSAAPATGQHTLDPIDDITHAALLAVDRATGDIVRISPVVEIQCRIGWRPLEILPPGEPVENPEILGLLAGDRVTRHVIPPSSTQVLASLPWNDGPVPEIAFLGMLGQLPMGNWMIRALDEAGNEVDRRDLPEMVFGSGLPRWSTIRNEPGHVLPGQTSTIELIFQNHHPQLHTTIYMANPRYRVPDAVPLPDGVTRITRIPAAIDRIAIDVAGRRLAVSCPSAGVRVMNLRDGTLGRWRAIPDAPGGTRFHCGWLMIAGDFLIHADHVGRTHVIDLNTDQLMLFEGFFPENFQPSASRAQAISPDGTFIAHDMAMSDGARLVRLTRDGIFESRMLETGLVNHLSFDAAQTTLTVRGLRGTWTLPLDHWKHAGLRHIPGPNAAAERYPLIQNGKGEYERMISPDVHIVRVPPDKPEVFQYNPDTKRLHLPNGMTVTDGEDTLWHVTDFGAVYRISLPEIMK